MQWSCLQPIVVFSTTKVGSKRQPRPRKPSDFRSCAARQGPFKSGWLPALGTSKYCSCTAPLRSHHPLQLTPYHAPRGAEKCSNIVEFDKREFVFPNPCARRVVASRLTESITGVSCPQSLSRPLPLLFPDRDSNPGRPRSAARIGHFERRVS